MARRDSDRDDRPESPRGEGSHRGRHEGGAPDGRGPTRRPREGSGDRPPYRSDRPRRDDREGSGDRPPYRSDRPRRDDREGGGGRPPYRSDRPRRDDREGSGGRPPFRSDRPRRDDREGGGDRPPYRSDRPRRDDREGGGGRPPYRSDRPRRDDREGGGDRPPYRSDRPRRDDREGGGGGGRPPYRSDRPRRDDHEGGGGGGRPPYRSDRPRRDDREGGGDRPPYRSDRPRRDDREGGGGGGRPPYRSDRPRRDDREGGGDRPPYRSDRPRRDDHEGGGGGGRPPYRSDRPRRDDREGGGDRPPYRSDRPRRDDREGGGGGGRPPYRSDRPRRDDREGGGGGGRPPYRSDRPRREEHYRAPKEESEQAPAEQQLKLVATCALGLELVVGRELEALGLGPISRINAQVSFPYSPHNLAKANYWLRSADRVWLQLAEFPARDFEELYQGVHSIDWAEMLPRDAWFPVEAITTKSRLESESSIQAVAKKAAVEKMSATYGRTAFSESGARFAIRVFIVYDRARVLIDTSGEGLHRRGYRTYNAKAPLRETVAAALVLLSHWQLERELYDPMCGSGTILLEAASIGLRKAAGLDRSFASQRWDFVGKSAWEDVHREAKDLLVRRAHLRIYGSDVDGRVLKLAREHVAQAGFEGVGIQLQTRDVADFSSARKYGVMITNPPYGKRLETAESVAELTKTMAEVFEPLHETWSLYFFTAFEDFLTHYGREPERVRKIYNGTIPCQFFQYPGPKPPGLSSDDGAGGSAPVRKRIRLNQ